MRDYKFNCPAPAVFSYTLRSSFNISKSLFIRSSYLPYDFFGKKIFIYDGRGSRFIFVKPEHLNHSIGSFIFTKRTGSRIHVDKSKKDKKK